MAIKHIVLWTLHAEADGRTKAQNMQLLKEKLESLPGKIEQIKWMEVGLNFNSTPEAFDVSLFMEFLTKADLEIYQEHPEHQKVVAFVRKVRNKRAVTDYEIR